MCSSPTISGERNGVRTVLTRDSKQRRGPISISRRTARILRVEVRLVRAVSALESQATDILPGRRISACIRSDSRSARVRSRNAERDFVKSALGFRFDEDIQCSIRGRGVFVMIDRPALDKRKGKRPPFEIRECGGLVNIRAGGQGCSGDGVALLARIVAFAEFGAALETEVDRDPMELRALRARATGVVSRFDGLRSRRGHRSSGLASPEVYLAPAASTRSNRSCLNLILRGLSQG